MSADDDTFDIDIYGDDIDYDNNEIVPDEAEAAPITGTQNIAPQAGNQDSGVNQSADAGTDYVDDYTNPDAEVAQTQARAQSQSQEETSNQQQAISSTADASAAHDAPKQAPVQQGLKRKASQEGSDARPTEAGATSALKVNELQWWTTEDDLRGWANQAGCEDEVVEITFFEFKINGKSRGLVPIRR